MVDAPQGELLIRTCERLGIVVPRFCDHPLLDPAGACRQCLVEVEMGGRKMPKPQASCTMTVAQDMVVNTQMTSAVADKAQQGVMELLLINHPLDCPICDKGGECPLQNQAMSSGRADSRFVEEKRTFAKPLPISDEVLLDRERCVLCQRCTRFSRQIAGDQFIELLERGAHQQIGTEETAFGEGEDFQSYFSGNTIQICPVGALTSASYRFRSRPFDLVSTPGVSEHDSSGAAVRRDWRRGAVTRVLAGEDPDVNEEWIDDKTRFAFRYAQSATRITRPLVRGDDGELHEASWTDALERAAAALLAARDGTGPAPLDADGEPGEPKRGVGVLPGGRLTIEDAYAYAKFARVALGTNDIDARARAHSGEELDFLAAHVAGTGLGVTYADLESAPAVLTVALEVEEEAPVVFLRLRKAARTGTAVHHLGQWSSPAVVKTGGRLVRTAPGREPEALGHAARRRGRRARDAGRGRAGGGARRRGAGSLRRRLRPRRRAPGPAWPGCRAGPVSAARWTPARCRPCCPADAPSTTSPAPSSRRAGGSPTRRPCPRRRVATAPPSCGPPPPASSPGSWSAASSWPTSRTRCSPARRCARPTSS